MGISIWQLLIIVAIVVLLFGTKKLKTLGSDLGESIKGFKKAMNEDEPVKPQVSEKKQDDLTQSESVKQDEHSKQ